MPSPEAFEWAIKVAPRSSRNKAEWQGEDLLKVWLTAPPVDGEANAALIAFLAEALKLPKASVEIIRGHTARQKCVRISGIDEADARKRVGTLSLF